MPDSVGTSSFGIFPGSNNVVIKGGYFSYSEPCESPSRVIPDRWEHLFQAIDPGAFHDSVNRKESPRNLPRQYEEGLRSAMDWAKESRAAERVLWVHGSSCASAISRSVADFQQDHGLLATYFVSKNPDNLYTLARFISTVTYQLARSFPRAREEITNIVAQDPAILSLSVNRQLQTLIINPLASFLSVPDGLTATQHHPALIVVDGCDYLDKHTQKYIVDALLRISQEIPLHVRILLSTKSSAMITSLASSIGAGLVTQIAFSNKRYHRANIRKLWNKIKNVARKRNWI